MGRQTPIVDYLVLPGRGEDGARARAPQLVANRCEACGALYFDRRNACARCSGTAFGREVLATTGSVRTFTIVHRAAPGVDVPYVSAVIDLDGGGVVKANLLEIAPDPKAVQLGMPVRLTTYVAGLDDEGTEAIAFAFEPAVGSEPVGERGDRG